MTVEPTHNPTPPAPARRARGWARPLAVVALVIAGVLFVRRALLAEHTLWDFDVHDAGTRAWLAGGNPYDRATLERAWDLAHPDGPPGRGKADLVSVAPPTSHVPLAAVSAAPPAVARRAWQALSVGCVGVLAMAPARMLGWPLTSARALLFAAVVLAWGPVQFAAQAGQVALPAAACVVGAALAVARGRAVFAGVALGVACALKVQIGLPFVALYAWTGRRRVAGWAVVTLAVAWAVAAGWLRANDVPWWPAWAANLRALSTGGGVNDYATANALREHLVNVQVPIYALLNERLATQATAAAVVGGLLAAYLVRVRRAVDAGHEVLALAAGAGLLLMPVYHRYYDAPVLALALAWALHACRGPRAAVPWPAAVAGTLCLGFLAPFGVPTALVGHGVVDRAVTSAWWWHALVVPYPAWLVAALTATLVVAMYRVAPRAERHGEPPSTAGGFAGAGDRS